MAAESERVSLSSCGNLNMTSRIRNIDSKPFSFSFGYHTYLSVSDICEVRIECLETLDYLDNLSDRKRFTEQGDAITFESEVDRAYLSMEDCIAVVDHGKKRTIVIKKGLPAAAIGRPSKSVADYDMAQVKPQNNIPVGSSCPLKYVEQLHPNRSGNTQNDTSLQKAKGVELSRDAEPKNMYAQNDVYTVEGTFPCTCSPVASLIVVQAQLFVGNVSTSS